MLGFIRANSIRTSVVFPAPVSPSIAVHEPGRKSNDRLDITSLVPSSYLYVTFSRRIPHGAPTAICSPCSSRGSAANSIRRSAAVNTLTKAGASFVRLRAGLCILFTSCRKAVIPPNVSVPADIRNAAQRKAMRYPRANPKLMIKLEKIENDVRLTTFSLSLACVSSSRCTISLQASSVFITIRCCIVSCITA